VGVSRGLEEEKSSLALAWKVPHGARQLRFGRPEWKLNGWPDNLFAIVPMLPDQLPSVGQAEV